MLMSKIILKNKKYYFNIFSSKNHFKKQSQPHFQTGLIVSSHSLNLTIIIL